LTTSNCFAILPEYDFRICVGIVLGQLSYAKKKTKTKTLPLISEPMHFNFCNLCQYLAQLPCLISTSSEINRLPYGMKYFYNIS